MDIQGLSPSSFKTSKNCEMCFFAEQILKFRSLSGKSAAKGTTFHSVFEALALIKLARDKQEKIINHDSLGGVWDIPDELDIPAIVEQIFNYFVGIEVHLDWTKADLRDIQRWVKFSLEYRKGELNPLNLNIVHPELRFDLPIQADWAKLDEENRFVIRGVVDLITLDEDGFLCVMDYKTGQQKDFHTGKAMGYEDFMQDIQLRVYHYAIRQLFPQYPDTKIEIFYPNGEGIFSLHFSDDDLADTEKMIKDRFLAIKAVKKPKQNKSWKCEKFCMFAKESFEKPMIEFRDGKFAKKGQKMKMCDELDFVLREKGLDWVIQNYKKAKPV